MQAVKEEIEKQRLARSQAASTPVCSIPSATCASRLPGNASSIAVNGGRSSPQTTSFPPSGGKSALNPATVTALRNVELPPGLPNGENVHLEKSQTHPANPNVRSDDAFFAPTSAAMNGIDGVASPPHTAAVSSVHCSTASTTSPMQLSATVSNCNHKTLLTDDPKMSAKAGVDSSLIINRQQTDEGGGRYSSFMDTPQDTPSSDSGLPSASCSTNPVVLQAKLANCVQQTIVTNGTTNSKASPSSPMSARQPVIDGVLSPPGTVPSADQDQLCVKAENGESSSAPTAEPEDPFEEQMFELSLIKRRPLPSLLRPFGVSENAPAREVLATCR